MIDSLAADLKGTGVRANSILPSIIDTEANRKAMPKADFAKWPKPEDIARVVLFLCGDDAKLVQGASVSTATAEAKFAHDGATREKRRMGHRCR
jgi:NAD(P)-dependent dehydrogenase (short-subunit alcohol dehydrogenase family)